MPTRGAVPPAVVPRAQDCVRLLRERLTLLAGAGRALDQATLGAELRAAGLTAVTVRPGPAFAASDGDACIMGTLAGDGKPSFAIAAGGSCQAGR